MDFRPLFVVFIIAALGFFMIWTYKRRKDFAASKDPGNVMLNDAHENEKIGNYDEATAQYKKAENYFRDKGDTQNVARTVFMHALACQRAEWCDEAEDLFIYSAELCRQIGDSESLGHSYMKLSENYEMQSMYPAAEDYQQRAMDVWRKNGNENLAIYACYRLGLTRAKIGKKKTAVADLEEALRFYSKSLDLDKLVPALLEAADVEAEVGAKNLALTHYREAEKHLRRLRDKKGEEEVGIKIAALEKYLIK